MRRLIFLLGIIVLIATGSSTLLVRFYSDDILKKGKVSVDGYNREFYYYIPQNVSAHPHLLFVIHSGNMDARDMQLVTGHQFNDLADKYKDVIIVYPQGYDRHWNDCRVSNENYTKYHNIDDVGFFEKMINYFAFKYNIDHQSVYAVGFAAGSQMCMKLAKEKPALFKGFSFVCGNMPVTTNDDCFDSNEPASVLFINGTADSVEPYNGGAMYSRKGDFRGYIMSTYESVNYWIDLDKGDTSLRAEYNFPHQMDRTKTSATQYFYPCNATGKKVMLVKVENGGHVFPNPVYNLWSKRMGTATADINAAQVTMDFFRSL